MAQSIKQVEGDPTVHYVSKRKQRAKPKPKMQPPMTPMIDVVFQLLLFFLLSTTFRQSEGNIPGTLPALGPHPKDQPATDIRNKIQITVRPTTERTACLYELSGQNTVITNSEELYKQLMGRRSALGGADPPIIIEPRNDVQWQFAVEAYNQAVRAKFKNIMFAS